MRNKSDDYELKTNSIVTFDSKRQKWVPNLHFKNWFCALNKFWII